MAVQTNQLKDGHRVIWRAKDPDDNIIFLATKDTLIDMIEDTTEPTDTFEIWQDIQTKDLKD